MVFKWRNGFGIYKTKYMVSQLTDTGTPNFCHFGHTDSRIQKRNNIQGVSFIVTEVATTPVGTYNYKKMYPSLSLQLLKIPKKCWN